MSHHSPNHSDADRLNTLLDALATGKRAPEAGSASDIDAFAATHRLVSGESAADASGTPSEHMLDEIWRTALHASSPAAPGHVPESTPPQSARQKARLGSVPAHPKASRFQTLLSMGAVAAMLLVAIGAAWFGGGGSGSNDPEPGRYAAVPLDQRTPGADGDVWYTPVMPEDCVAERMERETYADIMRSGPTPAPRSYLPITPVSRGVATDVALAGRTREACLIYGEMEQWRTMETSSALYARTAGTPEPSSREAAQREELSQHLPVVPFNEQFTYTQERMPESLANMTEGLHEAQMATSTYLPAYAYELGDGRVAIAQATIFWANPLDEHFKVWVEEDPATQSTTYAIFSRAEGSWLFDETVTICEGKCDEGMNPSLESASATPAVRSSGDGPDWNACPDESTPMLGTQSLSLRQDVEAQSTPGLHSRDWMPEQAQPPTIPCVTPEPFTPGTPPDVVPLG